MAAIPVVNQIKEEIENADVTVCGNEMSTTNTKMGGMSQTNTGCKTLKLSCIDDI